MPALPFKTHSHVRLATRFKITSLRVAPSKILLLKTGSFELAIVRMSRLMDLSQNAVLYGDVMLPQEAFYTSDSLEMKLVAFIFETAKSIAELKLTETELALYQSLVLLWPGEWHWRDPRAITMELIKCLCINFLRTERGAWQHGDSKTIQHEHVRYKTRTGI